MLSLTLLLPATRHDPSEAIVTDRIGTSPAGAYMIQPIIRRLDTEEREDMSTNEIKHANVLRKVP